MGRPGKAAPSEAEIADGASPRRGWGSCLGHVAQYHLVMAVMLTLVWVVLPLEMSWSGLVAGLAVSAVTHAFLDRRWPVRWLLEHVGSKGFAELKAAGMNGMYLTDLLCTDSEIEAVIEAPAEDLITFRQVLTQVLGYGRADAVPTRVGI